MDYLGLKKLSRHLVFSYIIIFLIRLYLILISVLRVSVIERIEGGQNPLLNSIARDFGPLDLLYVNIQCDIC